MNVLALLTDGVGASGGIARFNQDLLSALTEMSSVERIFVLSRYGSPSARSAGKLIPAPVTSGRAAWALRACGLALRNRIDIIFCGHIYAAPLAAGLARLTGAHLWIQTHGIEAWERPGAQIMRATGQADLVTAVSRYTRRRLLGWSNLPPERVRVLPNTVRKGYDIRPRRDDLMRRYNTAGRKLILTVGRISKSERYKGHDRIIAALPFVAKQCPSVAYLIVGSGDDIPRLEVQALRLGVRDRVIFAGHVTEDELPDHFALADVFAMPSTGEGFGIVFLEAAKSGLFVIGGSCDGSVDALANGSIGCLIDPNEQSSLIAALIAGLETNRLANPKQVERFEFENFAKHVNELVKSLRLAQKHLSK